MLHTVKKDIVNIRNAVFNIENVEMPKEVPETVLPICRPCWSTLQPIRNHCTWTLYPIRTLQQMGLADQQCKQVGSLNTLLFIITYRKWIWQYYTYIQICTNPPLCLEIFSASIYCDDLYTNKYWEANCFVGIFLFNLYVVGSLNLCLIKVLLPFVIKI